MSDENKEVLPRNISDKDLSGTKRESDTADEMSRIKKAKSSAARQLKSDIKMLIPTDNYEDVMRGWMKQGKKIAFIYECIMDKYRKRLRRWTLAAFVLTSITSLLSLGNFGIQEEDMPELTIAMKAATAALTTSSAIATGVISIFSWTQLVSSCQKYLDTVEHFVSSIISELTLPVKFRTDPDMFIMNQKDKYQAILNSAPDVPHSDYIIALEKYEESKLYLRPEISIV